MADAKADDEKKAGPTKDEIAKKLNVKVRDVKKDKDGSPVLKDGKIVTEDRAISANDILSFKSEGGMIVAVTIDGQKHQVAA